MECVAVFSALLDHGTTTITDALGRSGGMDGRIKPLQPQYQVCGPAVTVSLPPGDNLDLWHGLYYAKPGDVLVVDAGGRTDRACWGELMSLTAMRKGVGGLVIDGAIRDVQANQGLGFSIFCRAVAPGSCSKKGGGLVQEPIQCGGITVYPGDIVVGDADGVAVVPRAELKGLLQQCDALKEKEIIRKQEIEAGQIFPTWFLRDRG